jgi:hypothetical protein
MRNRLAAIAAAALTLLAAGAAAAAPAASAGAAAPQTTCANPAWQTLTIGTGASAAQWVRSSDNFGGGDACLNAADSALDYKVISQDVAYTGSVLAYPNLSIGCSFPGTGQYCTTTGDPFPLKVSATTGALLNWSISDTGGSASDIWDAGTDDWFEAGSGSSCPASYTTPVTEIMVWPSEQGQAVPARAVEVSVGSPSRNYWRWSQTVTSGTLSWTEVIYERAPLTSTLTSMQIGAVYQDAVTAGYLADTDCEVLASAGHEILKGGTDLATTSLSRTFS